MCFVSPYPHPSPDQETLVAAILKSPFFVIGVFVDLVTSKGGCRVTQLLRKAATIPTLSTAITPPVLINAYFKLLASSVAFESILLVDRGNIRDQLNWEVERGKSLLPIQSESILVCKQASEWATRARLLIDPYGQRD
jgi:hypothetical protein